MSGDILSFTFIILTKPSVWLLPVGNYVCSGDWFGVQL